MNLIALVSSVILLEYFAFVVLVGKARSKTGVDAPAVTGAPELERAIRVQTNSLEQMVIALPAMWMFGMYMSEQIGAALGCVYIIGRAMYAKGYMEDPKKRAMGFVVGFAASAILLLGAIVGVIQSMM
jgi:glutathione S-transferase